MLRTLTLVGAVLLLAGCGAGGVVRHGDQSNGRKLFIQQCGGCHTLAAAGTQGNVGPNLDDAFAEPRKEGFKESSIADIVAGQIRAPGQYSTKANDPNYLGANMPAHLVTGTNLNDVAEFVAANAGAQGFAEQTAVTSTNGKVIFKTKCGGCHTLACAQTMLRRTVISTPGRSWRSQTRRAATAASHRCPTARVGSRRSS